MSDADKIIEQLQSLRNADTGEESCDLCHDRGFFFNEQHQAINCKCQKSKLLHKLYKEANIPSMYFGMTMIDDWDRNMDAFGRELASRKEDKIRVGEFINHYIKVLPYLSEGKKASIDRKSGRKIMFNSLLIVGGSHSGKTMIVSILCQEMINRAKTARYYEWHNLSSILAEFRNSDSVDDIVDDFANKDLIVIDGVMPYNLDSPSFLFNLNRISSTRLQSGKPTVITCVPGYSEHLLRAQSQTPERVAIVWSQLLDSCFEVVLP